MSCSSISIELLRKNLMIITAMTTSIAAAICTYVIDRSVYNIVEAKLF